jgi:hypothetical protein
MAFEKGAALSSPAGSLEKEEPDQQHDRQWHPDHPQQTALAHAQILDG